MNYPKLNQIIFNELLERSQYSEYFILNYDNEVHNSVLQKAEITTAKYWKILREYGGYYWRDFIEETEDIPLIYGILSAQLFVYSTLSGDEYNSLLASSYGFYSHDLQQAYLYSQDDIWLIAKNHLESVGFKTIIPRKTSGPWRFVRYPKSQGYLRFKDLRKLHPHLNKSMEGLDLDNITLNLFVNRTSLDRPYSISSEFKSNNFIEKIDSPFKKAIYNQVLNYFLETEFTESNSQTKPCLYYCQTDGLFVMSDSKKYNLKLQDPLVNQFIKIDLNPKKLFILELDEQWGDYKEVSNIFADREYYLLLQKNTFLHKRLSGINFKYLNLNDYVIFKLRINESNSHFFEEYISTVKPKLEIIKGIKVSRTAFMLGYGPVFKLDRPSIITINGSTSKIEKILDLSKLGLGKHILKIVGGGRRTIEIINTPTIKHILELKTGIDIKSYSIGGNDIIGQNINLYNRKITPRNFINANMKNKRMKLLKSKAGNNLVLNNLKRSKNGSNWEN